MASWNSARSRPFPGFEQIGGAHPQHDREPPWRTRKTQCRQPYRCIWRCARRLATLRRWTVNTSGTSIIFSKSMNRVPTSRRHKDHVAQRRNPCPARPATGPTARRARRRQYLRIQGKARIRRHPPAGSAPDRRHTAPATPIPLAPEAALLPGKITAVASSPSSRPIATSCGAIAMGGSRRNGNDEQPVENVAAQQCPQT